MSSTGPLAPGTLIAGRYRVQSPLAGEGSSAIYGAVDTRLERTVALRVLPVGGGRGGAAQQGEAAARLVHANVARVLDYGEDAEAGVHFVAADPGSGGTLAALLEQRGAPPLPLALRMVQEAAAGMAAAHAAGLVHGDLHPGMLWLSRGEGRLRVQVMGLGLDPSGTLPPRATARYAAPERLRRAAALTAAADVFGLGTIAFELLAGLPDDWTSLLVAMARGHAVVAPSPAASRPELPPHVAEAVRRAILADPEGRWSDAGAMAARLFPARPKPVEAAPAAAADPPVKAPEPAPPRRRPGMERLGQPAPGRRGMLAAAAVAALLVGGGAVARALLAGPGTASADTGRLAARAIAGTPERPAAEEAPAEPVASAPAVSAAARTPIAAVPAPAVEAGGARELERERERAEERRRRERQREDSIRAAAEAEPPAVPPAPRAVQERPAPAQRIEQAVSAPAAPAPSPAAPDPGRVYGRGEVDRAPALSNTRQFQSAVQRTYPSALRGTGTAGSTVISFVVLPDGRVDRSTVAVSDLTNPAFRTAAISAAAAARFTPATVGGRAVRARASMSITWQAPERE